VSCSHPTYALAEAVETTIEFNVVKVKRRSLKARAMQELE
jgi:hypothetical protein